MANMDDQGGRKGVNSSIRYLLALELLHFSLSVSCLVFIVLRLLSEYLKELI